LVVGKDELLREKGRERREERRGENRREPRDRKKRYDLYKEIS
jgi:hypothetical protein